MMNRFAVILLLFPLGSLPAQQRSPFMLAGRSVMAGTRGDISLAVPAGRADPATSIPVTVLHGVTDGPVLAITAGVHGFEYPPILAAQRLGEGLDPRTLRGTVLLVRIAHVEAFENRVPFVNPYDRKNLNRVFPGRVDGTQSERIAWAITTEVIRRCDVHVEMHGGDGSEWLEPFVGIYGGTFAERQYPQSRSMGLAFGFRNIVRYSMNTLEDVNRGGSGRSLNRQAVFERKPTILVEIGENGRTDPAWVDPIVAGTENLLRLLQMAPGTPMPPRADTRWFDGTTGANATVTGILTPVAVTGRMIAREERLGIVRDYFGRVIEEIVAPVDGYALYGLAGPPVKAGETVVTIALPARGPL